jgi:hypothetical protein
MWLGPPQSRMKMHDFSARFVLLVSPTRAATIPGVATLKSPAPPACRNRRRDSVLDLFMDLPGGEKRVG